MAYKKHIVSTHVISPPYEGHKVTKKSVSNDANMLTKVISKHLLVYIVENSLFCTAGGQINLDQEQSNYTFTSWIKPKLESSLTVILPLR